MKISKFKGLQNRGENNCFINVVVQFLWTIKPVRDFIMSHTHQNPSFCLTCELSSLFTNMSYSELSNFSTNTLRRALTSSSPEFEELKMGCAVEAFEEILSMIHNEALINPDTCESCATHKFFGYSICGEISCCDNFELGEVESSFLMRTYSRDLEAAYRSLYQPGKMIDFCEILGKALNTSERKNICKSCGTKNGVINRWIQTPEVLGISIVWDPAGVAFAEVILRCLNEFLYSKGIYYSEDNQKMNDRYLFRGIICFSYSHYSAFIYELDDNSWYQVDDNVVRKMKGFNSVISMMKSNRSLPVLLVYEDFNERYQKIYRKKVESEFEEHIDNRECFGCELF